MDVGSILTALGMAVGAGLWNGRLEGRISVQAQRVDDLKELINERFDAVDKRLTRIETCLNGALKH